MTLGGQGSPQHLNIGVEGTTDLQLLLGYHNQGVQISLPLPLDIETPDLGAVQGVRDLGGASGHFHPSDNPEISGFFDLVLRTKKSLAYVLCQL